MSCTVILEPLQTHAFELHSSSREPEKHCKQEAKLTHRLEVSTDLELCLSSWFLSLKTASEELWEQTPLDCKASHWVQNGISSCVSAWLWERAQGTLMPVGPECLHPGNSPEIPQPLLAFPPVLQTCLYFYSSSPQYVYIFCSLKNWVHNGEEAKHGKKKNHRSSHSTSSKSLWALCKLLIK